MQLRLPVLALEGHPGVLGVKEGAQQRTDGAFPQLHRPQRPLGGGAAPHPGEELPHAGGKAAHQLPRHGGEHQHQLLFGGDGVALDRAGGVEDPAAAGGGQSVALRLRLGHPPLGVAAGQLPHQGLVYVGFQPQPVAHRLGHGLGGVRLGGGKDQYHIPGPHRLQQLGVNLRPPGGHQPEAPQGEPQLPQLPTEVLPAALK